MHTHKHKQTEPHHDENRALSPAAYHTNKPVHKKCSLRRWKRSCKVVGRMGRRRFGIFSRFRSRFSRQNRENGGFAAKTFTRAKTILPTNRALKNAAEIQFGTKFLFGLLIELIIRCDFLQGECWADYKSELMKKEWPPSYLPRCTNKDSQNCKNDERYCNGDDQAIMTYRIIGKYKR